MEKENSGNECCSETKTPECTCGSAGIGDLREGISAPDNGVCCGDKPGPGASLNERPGYRIRGFVNDFIETPVGLVPRVNTRMNGRDLLGTFLVRIGITRNVYTIAPGIYCVGTPGPESPVFVTANYKLSFDSLRVELKDMDAWILVLDTRGVNVWCSAGKGLFSTDELVSRIERTGLSNVVSHREVILPQLSATGVRAVSVKKRSGFRVIWGPVRASHLKAFMDSGKKADKNMRTVTFPFLERLKLIPVEIYIIKKTALILFLALFLISGFGPGFFSFSSVLNRGIMAVSACIAGIVAGTVITPALLPWIPGIAFSKKGTITGVLAGLFTVLFFLHETNLPGLFALMLISSTMASFTAMNFTGSTPFTSPSGVEKEMRKSIPYQAIAAGIGLITWIGSAFI